MIFGTIVDPLWPGGAVKDTLKTRCIKKKRAWSLMILLFCKIICLYYCLDHFGLPAAKSILHILFLEGDGRCGAGSLHVEGEAMDELVAVHVSLSY